MVAQKHYKKWKTPNGPACVYFMRMGGAQPTIKIGFCTSANLRSRLHLARSHSPFPVEMLGAIEGDRQLERQIQEFCIADHLRGEWFDDCVRVRSVIMHMMTVHPVLEGDFTSAVRDRLARFKVAA